MKRFFIWFLLLTSIAFCALPAFAKRPKLPEINNIPALFGTVASGTGSATEYVEFRPVEVDASGAMKVKADIQFSSFTTYQTTSATAGSTSATVTALSGRRLCALTNIGTETFWTNPGGSTATVSSGLPVYPGQSWSDFVDASVPIAYRASTPVPISITQGK